MHREVNLTKRIRTSAGLRYCPVVLSANGRVKPDAVLVNGKPERHTEGAYYLEWSEGSKRIRLPVGKDAADASARRRFSPCRNWLGRNWNESGTTETQMEHLAKRLKMTLQQ